MFLQLSTLKQTSTFLLTFVVGISCLQVTAPNNFKPLNQIYEIRDKLTHSQITLSKNNTTSSSQSSSSALDLSKTSSSQQSTVSSSLSSSTNPISTDTNSNSAQTVLANNQNTDFNTSTQTQIVNTPSSTKIREADDSKPEHQSSKNNENQTKKSEQSKIDDDKDD